MGQYYIVANPDKGQYLHPHRFGSGLKLMEFSGDGESVMQGLAVLLASGNGRGMGDLDSSHPLVGSWAGDRVVVAGDYGDEGMYLEEQVDAVQEGHNLYQHAQSCYDDISNQVIRLIVDAEGACSRLSKLDLEDDGWR